MSFYTLPHAPTIPVIEFHPHVPDAAIADLRHRLAYTAPRARTWDNTNGPGHLGTSHDWVSDMIEKWRAFDWRAVEAEIASFPSYHATVEYKGYKYKIHFLALFSAKRDATPIVFSHGWPGSVLEFVPMLNHIKSKYSPATLPNHIIVPALVGYGFSSPPPTDLAFGSYDNAAILDKMMAGLGFGREGGRGGYYAQGGDIGSFVTRQLTKFDSCIGIHLNFFPMGVPNGASVDDLDETDAKAMARGMTWRQWGEGYRVEHSTKPATIGAVLDSSPVAVLCWIGEKLEGINIKDRAKKLHFILADLSLYWYTNTAATCIWEYRSAWGKDGHMNEDYPAHIDKPVGYSQFMLEIMPTPIPFMKRVANIVHAKRHLEGGHFAALDEPVALWEDVQDYVKVASTAGAKL
ncbi:hypothetical protein CcaverHIS002_0301060 [Cutaneotrichosporon cavernicola]|uniref:Epoxide hydrolase N-terminal domain-containing protein n=1 Tax=Cutaneotrichosporon cavernicola TaxID=279322 RepID=A0AA48IIU7_9TREE|nr:uncharacterized protein CcaverHIS019_0301030 [Cutaneotrichosporon cavernicola]BEI82238.1 hypothetical protein CcaverHIS002_0301060 [Cutaneotrichosporon cavernicola]BEI90033.1 hypothetical protein CcaverHIS019_0301030 [Cutaneotrichosporon cavernicola]BEI97807.1 hypothetical protein CcaverHIS631_0301060 [Cutaneotrichosporon cavernicola]BEJ05584.1 hypothetical protein CcaverHIS641_0301060 [Cutaneotrichosporon cavernicola]